MVPGTCLGTALRGVDGVLAAVDDALVKCVLDVPAAVDAPEGPHVGFVFSKEERRLTVHREMVRTERRMLDFDPSVYNAQTRAWCVWAP